MVPHYHSLGGRSILDGFSLLIDQVRIDITLKYFLSCTYNILHHDASATNLFSYEYQQCHKIKANINWQNLEQASKFNFTILKLKFRKEALFNVKLNELQKQKLIHYFMESM